LAYPVPIPVCRRPCTLRQVGEAYAGNDNVLIAKIDATANDIPSNLFKVQVRRRSSLCVGVGCLCGLARSVEAMLCGVDALAHFIRKRCAQGALHVCGALPA
jgi:hypothetical protein